MRRGTVTNTILTVAATAALLVAWALPARADTATKIDLCCAWGTGILDGITYKVSASDAATRVGVSAAIQNWDQGSTAGLTLTEVFGKTPAEVSIKYKPGGGNIQGLARRTFDASGFIKGASISVSGKAFGVDNPEAVRDQIVMHEFGHALGLNHADGDGVLMSTTVTAGSQSITTCDRSAVLAADDWFFDGGTTPQQPAASSPC